MLLSNPYHPDDRVRNEALALVEFGYEVIILAWDRDGTHPEQETLSGLKIKRKNLHAGYGQGLDKLFGYLLIWFWFIKEMNRLKPAVIHCHDYDTYLAGCWYIWFHRRVKLVLDTHENYSMMMKPLVSDWVVFGITSLEKLLTRIAHLVVSSNQATADYYKSCGAQSGVVVGNWKNPVLFEFDVDKISKKRQELGIIDGQLVIAYIGALSADRNVIPLLQTLRTRSDAFLILGGKGDQENEIRGFCSEMQNVYFPGYIHPDQVPLFIAVADLIYYCYEPSHVYAPYNAPNKLYEALAAGKAVLASDLGGELSEVVKKEQCGVLISHVDPATIGAAIDLLAQDSVRSVMQARSKIAGETVYNLALAQGKLKDAYCELLSDRQ